MSEMITRAELARRLGMNHAHIYRLASRGVVKTHGPKKLVKWPEAKAAIDAARDPERGVAAEHWAAMRGKPTEDAAPTSGGGADSNEIYRRARAIEKTAQAQIKKLQLEELQGALVRIEAVRAEAEEVLGELYGGLTALPPRVASRSSGKTQEEVEAIVREELNACFRDARAAIARLREQEKDAQYGT